MKFKLPTPALVFLNYSLELLVGGIIENKICNGQYSETYKVYYNNVHIDVGQIHLCLLQSRAQQCEWNAQSCIRVLLR